MTAPTVTCQLNLPDREHFYGYIRANATLATRMVTLGMGKGRTLAICGAGPSLAETAEDMEQADEVWACNSALPYLWDRKLRVTHGVTIDQGEAMLADHEFGRCLPVQYLLASSAHPMLAKRLTAARRRVTFFHSFLGIPDPDDWDADAKGMGYELHLYTTLFSTSIMSGHGLNTVPRAICLAMAMQYEHVWVYGADCAAARTDEPMPARDTAAYRAWMSRLRFYADGRPASVYGDTPIAEGEVGGRTWHTRADMVISAQHLLDLQREYQRITYVGDVLPNALAQHVDDDAFMSRMPKLTRDGSVTGFGIPLSEQRSVA
jgi:hypothetical protein